jgi:hypothetical protein
MRNILIDEFALKHGERLIIKNETTSHGRSEFEDTRLNLNNYK